MNRFAKNLLRAVLVLIPASYFWPWTIRYPGEVRDAPGFTWGGAVCESFQKATCGGCWLPHRIGYAVYRTTAPPSSLPERGTVAAGWGWDPVDPTRPAGGTFRDLVSIYHLDPASPDLHGFHLMGPELKDIAGAGIWDRSTGKVYVEFHHTY